MNNGSLELMWQQADIGQLLMAVICGVLVGMIYFYSLRWSINKLSETSHKFRLFALTALCRIALFFGVLILIGHRNVAVIVLYVVAFFFTKAAIIWIEKNSLIKDGPIAKEENKTKNEL